MKNILNIMNCDVCNKIFYRRYNLERHVKIHNKNQQQKSEFQCHSCGLLFKKKFNMERHIIINHYDNSRRNNCVLIKCFLCKDKFKTRKIFGSHVERMHGLTLNIETILFHSKDDFQEWKTDLERRNKCKYVLTRGMPSLGKHYYFCHRDGHFMSKRKSFIRNSKIPDTVKMNAACTSQLIVSEEMDGMVQVRYTSTHFGHASDARRFYEMQHENMNVAEQSCDYDIEIQAMLELLMSLNKQTYCNPAASLEIKQHLQECINILDENKREFKNENKEEVWEDDNVEFANKETEQTTNYSVPIKTEVVYDSDTLEVCNVYI